MARISLAAKAAHWEKKAREYKEYSEELESRLKTATNTLQTISCGAVEAESPKEWSQNDRIQWTASNCIRNLANNLATKKPVGNFYI